MYGTINGLVDARLGTFFRDDGQAFRVNAQVTDRNISFYFKPMTPDLTSDAAPGTGTNYFTGTILPGERTITGTWTQVGSGVDAPFKAVRDLDNLAPWGVLYGAIGQLSADTRYTFGVLGVDPDGSEAGDFGRVACGRTTWRGPFMAVLSSTVGCEIDVTFPSGGSLFVQATVTDADGSSSREIGSGALLVRAPFAGQLPPPRAYLRPVPGDALNYPADEELVVDYEAYSSQQFQVTPRLKVWRGAESSASIEPIEGQFRFVPSSAVNIPRDECRTPPGALVSLVLEVPDPEAGRRSEYLRRVFLTCP